MPSYLDKSSENKVQAPTFTGESRQGADAVFQMAESGLAEHDPQGMQGLAQQSTRHNRMLNLQQLANNGSRSIQMKQLQAQAYPKSSAPIQRKTDTLVGPGFAIDSKVNSGSAQGIFQLAIGTDDSLIGTTVVDRDNELFILLRWSESRNSWKVQRENPGDKAATTYRSAEELNIFAERRGPSAMEVPEENQAAKVEKRKREPDAASGSAAAPAASSAKVAKKPPAKPKGMLSFDPDGLDDGEEADVTPLKKGSQMELIDPDHRKKLAKQERKAAQKSGKMEASDESASAAAPQHSHAAAAAAAPAAIVFPTAHQIVADAGIRAMMAKMLKHSTMLNQEYGGYIFWNPVSGAYYLAQEAPGKSHEIALDKPPAAAPGFIFVANFHTHPNADSHQPPSPQDVQLSSMRGIPGIVMDSAGKLYFSGPDSRSPGGDLGHYPTPDPENGYVGPQPVKDGHGVRSLK